MRFWTQIFEQYSCTSVSPHFFFVQVGFCAPLHPVFTLSAHYLFQFSASGNIPFFSMLAVMLAQRIFQVSGHGVLHGWPWTWLNLLYMHPVLSSPLPIGYIDLCVNTLWQTDHTLLCGSLRRMLFLLASMEIKYGVIFFCRQTGSSLARCLRFICIFWRAR